MLFGERQEPKTQDTYHPDVQICHENFLVMFFLVGKVSCGEKIILTSLRRTYELHLQVKLNHVPNSWVLKHSLDATEPFCLRMAHSPTKIYYLLTGDTGGGLTLQLMSTVVT